VGGTSARPPWRTTARAARIFAGPGRSTADVGDGGVDDRVSAPDAGGAEK